MISNRDDSRTFAISLDGGFGGWQTWECMIDKRRKRVDDDKSHVRREGRVSRPAY